MTDGERAFLTGFAIPVIAFLLVLLFLIPASSFNEYRCVDGYVESRRVMSVVPDGDWFVYTPVTECDSDTFRDDREAPVDTQP